MVKVVVVTGASKGIGKAIVEQLFAENGDTRVVGIARTEPGLLELKNRFGRGFAYLVGDVVVMAQQLVHFAIEKFGRIDCVICNAAISGRSPFHSDLNHWKEIFNVNFFSIVDLVSKMTSYLVETNGSIILVSSGSSLMGYDGWGAYGSSKAALNHFAMTIASEEPKISVIALSPGVVDTDMQKQSRRTLFESELSEEAKQRMLKLWASRELVEPQVPAKVYARMALNGVPPELNGQYVRYNDSRLSL